MAQDGSTSGLVFTSLEEVKSKPYPIRPIPVKFWTPDKIRGIWERMEKRPYMLSDSSKAQLEQVIAGTLGGRIHWFLLGNGLGLVHVYGIADGIGTVNVEFFGDKKKFIKAFGRAKDVKAIWPEAVMKWLRLRKLRATIAADNKTSVRFAENSGFVREGWLRKEWLVQGEPTDVYLYGLLRSELK